MEIGWEDCSNVDVLAMGHDRVSRLESDIMKYIALLLVMVLFVCGLIKMRKALNGILSK